MEFKNILIVCVGNICRSPVAEALLAKNLDNSFNVSSAGLKAVVDSDIHPISHDILVNQYNTPYQHKACQVTQEHINNSDLILVMERTHIMRLIDKYPSARSKSFLLTHWSGKRDIPDPYKHSKDMFLSCLDMVNEGVQQWSLRLLNS